MNNARRRGIGLTILRNRTGRKVWCASNSCPSCWIRGQRQAFALMAVNNYTHSEHCHAENLVALRIDKDVHSWLMVIIAQLTKHKGPGCLVGF